MSSDLRRRVAYFGPREKVYTKPEDCELQGLPLDWRRVLCTGYPSAVVGPMGCVYRTIEHAMAAFRVHYSTSNPCLAFLFRHENHRFSPITNCKEWSSFNALSMLLCNPDDRVWYVVRDRCMYDLVFQRICRDDTYRQVLRYLIEQRFLPVYHVRTAYAQTYWGGIIDKTKLNLTTTSAEQNRAASLDMLAEVSMEISCFDPASIIVGKNRLGFIMKSAMETYIQIYHVKMVLRANVFLLPTKQPLPEFELNEDKESQTPTISFLPAYPLTPLAVIPTKPPMKRPASIARPAERETPETSQPPLKRSRTPSFDQRECIHLGDELFRARLGFPTGTPSCSRDGSLFY